MHEEAYGRGTDKSSICVPYIRVMGEDTSKCDYRKSGRHVLLGAARLSVQDIMDRATSQVLSYDKTPIAHTYLLK
jgi:hypothetical protein